MTIPGKLNVKKISAYLEDPASFTVLVMEAEKLDARTTLCKYLSDNVIVVECELSEDLNVKMGMVTAMAAEMARALNVEMDRDAAQALAENTNAVLARMKIELEKLATYAGDRKRITRADVEALVVSRPEIFGVGIIRNARERRSPARDAFSRKSVTRRRTSCGNRRRNGLDVSQIN